MRHFAVLLLQLLLLSLLWVNSASGHQTQQIALWPTIPFIRGQDLCQYQDAYGRSKAAMARELTQSMIGLLREGASSSSAFAMVLAMDELGNKNRALASAGLGMDLVLEGSFKASLDAIYRDINPAQRKLAFFNTTPLIQVVHELHAQKRQGYLDQNYLAGLSAVVWGIYAYSASCRGDLTVTLHFESKEGTTYNFQGQGSPESVMQGLAGQVFEFFQKTNFPSKVKYGNGFIELLGAPGSPISHATSPENAEQSCIKMQGRLPSAEEYVFLSSLGDWSGGITMRHEFWAMARGMVMAPDLPNPSPVRKAEEIRVNEYHFYCLR
jgi:hypothetical protein